MTGTFQSDTGGTSIPLLSVESIISQELSHLSPCARIVSVTIETTTDPKEKVLMEEMRKRKAEYDNGMAERIVNYVKTGIK